MSLADEYDTLDWVGHPGGVAPIRSARSARPKWVVLPMTDWSRVLRD